MTTRDEVFAAINTEREYQDVKWGGQAHDRQHSLGDFLMYMEYQLKLAKDTLSSEHDRVALPKALNILRKVTTLGVVCMEQHGAPCRSLEDLFNAYAARNLEKAFAETPAGESLRKTADTSSHTKGHNFGPVEDLHMTCMKCGLKTTVVSLLGLECFLNFPECPGSRKFSQP